MQNPQTTPSNRNALSPKNQTSEFSSFTPASVLSPKGATTAFARNPKALTPA